MEVNSSIETIGIHDLYLVNLSNNPVTLGLNLLQRTGQWKRAVTRVCREITFLLAPKESERLTRDRICVLSDEMFREVKKATIPARKNFKKIRCEYQSAAPSSIHLDASLDFALVVLDGMDKDRAVLLIKDRKVSKKYDLLHSIACEKICEFDLFWKCLSFDQQFVVNPVAIYKEFQLLAEHENQIPVVEYHWSMIYQLLEGSIVDLAIKSSKAGEPETIFTEDPHDSFIPKILHQIYFGCDPVRTNQSGLPANFEECVQSWVDKHCLIPGEESWNHIIWTLKECWKDPKQYTKFVSWCEKNAIQVKNLSDEFIDQEDWIDMVPVLVALLEQNNWGFGSDFARYLILNEYGGIYADLDVRCHHRLNHTELLNTDFFAALDENQGDSIWIEGAILGASKGSLIFTKILQAMRILKLHSLFDPEAVDGFATLYLSGPILLSVIVGRYLPKLSFPRVYPPSFFFGKTHPDLYSIKSFVPSTNCIAFHSSTKTWLQNDRKAKIDNVNVWKKIIKKIIN